MKNIIPSEIEQVKDHGKINESLKHNLNKQEITTIKLLIQSKVEMSKYGMPDEIVKSLKAILKKIKNYTPC